MIPVFDGHNDFLQRMVRAPQRRAETWLTAGSEGHIDLPRMRAGGMVGGLFAVYVPSPPAADGDGDARLDSPPYDLPLPAPVPCASAQAEAMAMVGQLMWMERTGTLSICRSTADIRAAMARDRIAAVLHFEGAEAIGPDLDALHLWHAAGLRSLGPVWSRPNAFGHGVPFAFPASPDRGPGLTEAGRRLVRECNRLRILIDLSHVNARGFDDIAAISDAPLIASHSNAHAVTPSSRNLTDRQLDMIAERDGLVGLNFATIFLREDGRPGPFTGWEPILRHLDHLIGRLGETRVGLGSDFDGATMPAALADASRLPALFEALAAHGYDAALLRRIGHENWLAALARVWGG